jgi:hypothetical protein
VYVTGATSSSGTGTSGFPTKSPIYAANAGGSDGFVTKIKGDFTALIYSTYLGGSGNDTAYGIALDGANPPNAYVTGSTASSNFPGVSPLQSTLGSVTATNAFVTEVNGAGSVITYSTYLGGTKSDMGRGIAADASGNAYIVGTATSSNFPVLSSSGVTASPFQGSLGSASGNAFVGKISPAAAASALNFFPPIYNFGEVAVGAGSAATGGFATETVTLSNNTSSSVSITSFSFTGTNAADFTLQAAAAPCLTSGAFAIPAGASCALTIKFAPSAQDTRSAQLTINSSPLSTSALMLSGFGAVPEISITPASMNFSTSAPLNIGSLNDVEITNTGGATLNVGSVQITGANASAFTLTENSCTSVAAGSSCFIEVTFTPTAAQAYNATLLINDNVDGSPQSVPLGGTGVAQVNVSPISIEYRGWIVGVQSSDAEITVTNGSGGSVTLTSIVAGTSTTQSNFHVDANPTSCTNGLVLPAGSSCNMAVYFKPNAGSAIDGLTGSFTFNWNGTVSGQQTVNVMGTGETGVTLYTNSINAFSEYVGVSESESAADIIYNGTTNPVTINSIVLSGANPADWTVNLGFSPTGSDCSADGIVPALSYCYLGGSFHRHWEPERRSQRSTIRAPRPIRR